MLCVVEELHHVVCCQGVTSCCVLLRCYIMLFVVELLDFLRCYFMLCVVDVLHHIALWCIFLDIFRACSSSFVVEICLAFLFQSLSVMVRCNVLYG